MKYQNDDEFLNKLKDEFNTISPPEIADNIKAQYKLQNKQKRTFNFLIRILKPAISFCMLIIVFLLIIPVSLEINNDTVHLNSKTIDELAFKSLSALSLFSFNDEINDELDNENNQNLKLIYEYIHFFEQLLPESITVDHSITSFRGYKAHNLIKYTSLFGEQESYDLYLNVHITNNNQKYRINGLLILNDQEYLINAHKLIENDYKENVFKIQIDPDQFVIITFNSEGYHYELHKNPETPPTYFYITLDNSHNVEVIREQTQLRQRIRLNKHNKNNQPTINVLIDEDDIDITTFNNEEGTSMYEFYFKNTGEKIWKNQYRKGQQNGKHHGKGKQNK